MNDTRIESLGSIEEQKAFILAVIKEADDIKRARPLTDEEKFGPNLQFYTKPVAVEGDKAPEEIIPLKRNASGKLEPVTDAKEQA